MKPILPLFVLTLCTAPLCAVGTHMTPTSSITRTTHSANATEDSSQKTKVDSQIDSARINDTLHVTSAQLYGPVLLQAPIWKDSLNFAGKSYEEDEVKEWNSHLVENPNLRSSRILRKGEAIDSNSVNGIRFTVDVQRWTKANLSTKKISNFDTYVNGILQDNQTIILRPGRTEIALLTYSTSDARDTFEVSVIGKDLAKAELNSSKPQAFSFDDMLHGERFYSMKMSPSGRYLMTMYYTTNRDGKNDYRTVLTDLHSQRTIYRSEKYEYWTWLEQEDKLYYETKKGGDNQLVLLDPATMQTQVIGTHLPEGSMALAPNGKFAIYDINEDSDEQRGALKQLKAPDDRQSGWRNRSALYYVDLTTGAARRLTFTKEDVHLNDISHDGQRILVSQNTHDLTRKPFDHKNVYEIWLEKGTIDTLLVDQPWLGNGQYSPDDKHILFEGSPSAFDGIGSNLPKGEVAQSFDQRLFLFDRSTRKATALLKDFKPSVSHAKWNRGDGFIYAECADGYDETMWRINPKNGQRERLNLPVSIVQGFTMSQTRKPQIAFFGQTGTTSRNGYVAELTSITPKCKPFGEVSFQKSFGNRAIASCTPWKFTTSRGDIIEGFYHLPNNFDATRKYPMIVYYYGGCMPITRALESYYPLSALANMGYVVLVVEPSGSIGFGEEFAARHINTWGKMSSDDIIEGTQTFLKEHPYVDTKKVGCMGASYGGFMTEHLQTRTNIFAAAISHAGISNIASYWGGGYWGHTYGETAQYGSYPWNNPDLYTKQSALFNADKIHTPLLLLHGTADTNVPTNESQQLFTALRILGRPVSYIQIKDANHVVTDYHQRKEWQDAIMAWFEKYLQDNDAWWKHLGFE